MKLFQMLKISAVILSVTMIGASSYFLIKPISVQVAASAPITVEETCPQILVQCSDGKVKSCNGTSNGQGGCVYSESCLSCSGGDVPELPAY